MGCGYFSLPIPLMMILRIRILYLIIIIKSEVWPICHCLGLHGWPSTQPGSLHTALQRIDWLILFYYSDSMIHSTWYISQHKVIQIKICAEYRDMLPRPRLVCQEPGLRPIGRSPGVPDKSSRGLGSMSRYSAQVLICFIAYIFLFFFHSSVGLVGNFAGLPVCTVPSAIVHCNQNEAGHQTIKAPSMPCSWPIKTLSGI